ncbi:unnamed protein product [Caenorhabditis auriculariae]|uniref:Major sperm protein n=1 Tax=Caenorhabditis auriculariae TaxID=2777116 RepID=A0A8S1HIR1_9PELO|nr:unnamed protein product [Caenorhabditis auriculariae]
MSYDFEDHDLFITPRISFFSSAQGGASRHMMVNGSSHRMAVKIKCSDNDLFRVSPVFCLLEPGNAQRLQIVRDPGPAKIDKIVLQYKTTMASNARDAFREGSGISRKLIALVAKGDMTVSVAPSTNLKTILPVKGKFLCDGKPYEKARLKLYEVDPIKDTLMSEALSNESGEFQMSGNDTEWTTIDPKLNVYHNCHDETKECWRKKSKSTFLTTSSPKEKIPPRLSTLGF